jgi:hypothetical protein
MTKKIIMFFVTLNLCQFTAWLAGVDLAKRSPELAVWFAVSVLFACFVTNNSDIFWSDK